MDELPLAKDLCGATTARLALRAVALADGYPLFEATRNVEFNRHLMWSKPDTVADVRLRLDTIIETCKIGKMVAVSAVLKTTGEWVGLYRFTPNGEQLEMGLWIHPKFWKGGYGRELTEACIDSAFWNTTYGSLVACTSVTNEPAIKVLEACELRNEGYESRTTEDGNVSLLCQFRIHRKYWKSPLT